MAAKKAIKSASAKASKPSKPSRPSKVKAKLSGNGKAAASSSDEPKKQWNLRLYVAGDSPRSRTALANLKRLCEEQIKDNYDIEVIDLTKRPDLAKADQILAVPTLVRKIPEPMKRIIGDLSNADRALIAFDMTSR